MAYAKENGFHTVCLTNHFWDDSVEGASPWYAKQGYDHIAAAKPLPEGDGVRCLFGCETELNASLTLGLSEKRFDSFDFIVIPTTHFHMKGFTVSESDVSSVKARTNFPRKKGKPSCGSIASPRNATASFTWEATLIKRRI